MEVQEAVKSKRKYGAINNSLLQEANARQRNRKACDKLLALLNEHHADHESVVKFLPKPSAPVKAAPVVPVKTLAPIPYGLGNIHPEIHVAYSAQPRRIDVISIIREVARRYNVTVMDIKSERRTWKLVRPRHIAMHLAKVLTQNSLPRIGILFGGRDHTTILHAVAKLEKERRDNSEFDAELNEISNVLRCQAAPIVSVNAFNHNDKRRTPCNSAPTANQ